MIKKTWKQDGIIFLIFVGLFGMITNSYIYADFPEREDAFNIPILMYHHITVNENEINSSTVSVEKFKQDMMYLKQNGYTTLHFQDVLDAKQQGKLLPEKSIIITFDDGYRSNYQYAYPILKELELKGTIFLIGWSMQRNTHKDGVTPIIPHLTWNEAREMYHSGVMDLQHHTYDLHNPIEKTFYYGKGVAPYTDESIEDYEMRFLQDIVLWKIKIEQKIGNHVFVFAYPYGEGYPLTEQILKENGFQFSLVTGQGINRLSQDNFSLSRINVTEEDSLEELIESFFLAEDF